MAPGQEMPEGLLPYLNTVQNAFGWEPAEFPLVVGVFLLEAPHRSAFAKWALSHPNSRETSETDFSCRFHADIVLFPTNKFQLHSF